jgi:colanic acid/amylovoran biosynthesis glycosyltransferase
LTSDRTPLLLEVGLKWPPEHYLRRKLEGLAADGIDVAVAASFDDVDAEMDLRGVQRMDLPRPDEPGAAALLRLARDCLRLGLRSPRAFLRLVRAIGRRSPSVRGAIRPLRSHLVVMLAKPDLVHIEWEGTAVDFLPLFEACRCPVVVSSHGGVHVRPKVGERRITSAYPDIFERAAAVHCVSEAVREEAVRFGLDRAKARVIHTAVDPDFFRPAPDDVRDAEELRVIGMGRLNWIKGYDYALEAVASLVRAGVPVSYEILGGEPSAATGKENDRARLLYLIHELGLEDRVRLLGKVSQEVVRERLWASDVLLQASLSEGMPNAVLEAMACALPVVVTDCPGMREAVEHGVEGFVCPRRSPDALADALASLRDRSLARKLGEAGRARVEAEFTLARQLESFRRLYSEVAAGSARRSANRRASGGEVKPSLENGRPNRW